MSITTDGSPAEARSLPRPYYERDGVTIFHGDALATLARLSADSVQCCVTSPPYFGLRDYGVDGQLGLEATPDEYVDRLVAIFREVRRTLRPDGTLWLNLGDSYANDGKWGGHTGGKHAAALHCSPIGRNKRHTGLKPKDLIGIPWLVAFALRADGWWLRSDIVWAKPNPMPESVTDRPTKSHEYVFLLSKSADYYYDADAIREDYAPTSVGRYQYAKQGTAPTAHQPDGDLERRTRELGIQPMNPAGRNRRTVWTIATQSYDGAHFATFPPDLVRPCILAGTSEHGACAACGAPWERVVERTGMVIARSSRRDQMGEYGRTQSSGTMVTPATSVTTGWRPTCACGTDERRPCVVLDPFAGAGTTLMVAKHLNRCAVGVEINEQYIGLMARRLMQSVLPLPQEAV